MNGIIGFRKRHLKWNPKNLQSRSFLILMKMRKITKAITIGILLCLFSLPGLGQVEWGIRGGMNLNNIRQDFKDGIEAETQMLFSYHAGVVMNYEFNDAWSLQPSLLYVRKGFSIDLEETLEDFLGNFGEVKSVEGYDRVIFNYLEMPVNFAYRFRNFQVYAGPYIATGIGGTSKWDYSFEFDGEKTKDKDKMKIKPSLKKIDYDEMELDEDVFYAIDFGVNLGVGYNFRKLTIATGYSNGFGNLIPEVKGASDFRKDNKEFNRNVNLSLTYFFGK